MGYSTTTGMTLYGPPERYQLSAMLEKKEYLTGFWPREKMKLSKCIIPADQWDGDTGIEQLLTHKPEKHDNRYKYSQVEEVDLVDV